MPDPYAPKKSDKFTFGLWTVGNPGRDPFGDPVREPMAPTYIVKMLSQLGATASTCTTTTWCRSEPARPSATASCASSRRRSRTTA